MIKLKYLIIAAWICEVTFISGMAESTEEKERAKTISDNWIEDSSPTAHFQRIGKLERSVGYAHLVFHVDLEPAHQEMNDLCSTLQSTLTTAREHTQKGKEGQYALVARGLTFLLARCHNHLFDFENMKTLWVRNLKDLDPRLVGRPPSDPVITDVKKSLDRRHKSVLSFSPFDNSMEGEVREFKNASEASLKGQF